MATCTECGMERERLGGFTRVDVRAHAAKCGTFGPDRCNACGFSGRFSKIASMIIQRSSGRTRTCPRCNAPVSEGSSDSDFPLPSEVEVEPVESKVSERISEPIPEPEKSDGKKRKRAPSVRDLMR
jgi:hypothetical protein